MNAKARLDLDKNKWPTSPLPGHIVLVSTCNRDKIPNVAPKSWISMAAVNPAIIGFGCNIRHQTARNILETREFVVNVPSADLANQVWKTGESKHDTAVRLRELGFTLIPAVKVSPPCIRECKAHFECVYESDKRYRDEIWIFGEMVHGSIDEKALRGTSQERYKYLNPMFYLEEKTYATLGEVRKAKITG